jgi:hypothetical protein
MWSATKAAGTIACRAALPAVRVLINWELAWSRDSTVQVAGAPSFVDRAAPGGMRPARPRDKPC